MATRKMTRIDDNLWREAKSLAAKQGKTLQQFLDEILRKEIKNAKDR